MSVVLLVEDEPWLGELYQKLLQKNGYKVNWCRDGYEAIDSIDGQRPDVIVLDVLLPWANGIALLHELASHGDLASIPAILCSNALPKDANAKQLAHYGVVAALDKTTMQPKQLLAAVKKALYANVSD
jgi:CheY-like chemotaxis protein